MRFRIFEHRAIGLGLKAALACVLLLSGADSQANSARLETQRAVFVEAESALKRGDHAAYQQHYAALGDYPLRPYLDFKRGLGKLSSLSPSDANAILTRLDATPLAARFRVRWINTLASQRKWSVLLQVFRATTNVEARCNHARALAVSGNFKAALERAKPLWKDGRSRPQACDPLFKTLLSKGLLTKADVWTRFELAMQRGNVKLARYLKKQLPSTRQRQASKWLALRARPADVADLAPAADLPDQVLTQYAMRRLALADGNAAAELWAKLKSRPGYTKATLVANQGHVGLGLALDHDPRAYAWLAALPDGVSESLREWRVRSAIRTGNWRGVETAIKRLTPAEQQTKRWRYWRARAAIALGRRNEGRKLMARIATARDYHAFLAADRLGLPYALNHRPTKAAPKQMRAIARDPTLARIRELLALGRVTRARSEWHTWLGGRQPGQVAAAALLVTDWAWPTAAITGLARIRQYGDLEVRFPVRYRGQVERNARALALKPSWIMAVVRQESAFASDARSPVGARGLMQIMPATGRQLARRLGKRLPNKEGLLDPSLNLLFGASYLAQLKDQFTGQVALATAAYNAGPHRVQRWLPSGQIDADQWIETIPFKETRRYVQRVLEYDIIYRARLGLPLGRITDALPAVKPGTAEVSDRL